MAPLPIAHCLLPAAEGQTDKHFYGGQAVLEGVMMRSREHYATAVRRADGSVVVGTRDIANFGDRHPWAKWPLIRGNFAMLDALLLGMQSLQFSGNVALEDEAQREAAKEEEDGAQAKETAEPQTLGGALFWLTMLPALALGVGLFILVPAYAVSLGAGFVNLEGRIAKNLVEGVIRLLLIVAYMVGIALIKDIRRVFEYHGAEHKSINTLEAGREVTVQNAMPFTVLHPRCGTAFILVVIVIKIIVNCFLPWPESRLVLTAMRLAVLPPVIGLSYEVIYYAGRHRDSLFARALSVPGLLLERLTTREPDEEQMAVAIYALAAVAPEVSLPDDFPAPEEVRIGKGGTVDREGPGPTDAVAGSPQAAERQHPES